MIFNFLDAFLSNLVFALDSLSAILLINFSPSGIGILDIQHCYAVFSCTFHPCFLRNVEASPSAFHIAKLPTHSNLNYDHVLYLALTSLGSCILDFHRMKMNGLFSLKLFLDIPKSANLTWPSKSSKMFSGFKSL